jgi:murein DD-endopeptidase MepM/ murein hydrolase activator NlpD
MRLSPKSAVFGSSSRLAVVAVLGAAVAGCSSDFSRTVEGPYSGTTSNQQAIIAVQPAASAYPGAQPYPDMTTTGSIGVQQSALPPMPTAQPVRPSTYAPQPAYQPANAPLYEAPRPVAAAPTPAPGPAPAGWSGNGGSYVTLMPGETLDTLSRRYNVPVAAIASANNFADAGRVLPGQRVLIPTYSAPAPQAPRAALPQAPRAAALPTPQPPRAAALPQNATPRLVTGAPPAVASKPAVAPVPAPVAAAPKVVPAQPGVSIGPHVVKKGETLDGIARSYGTTKTRLMTVNGLKGDTLQIGQKLVLPSGVVLKVAKTGAPAVAPVPVPAPAAQVVAKAPVPAAPVPQPVQVAAQPAAPAPVIALAQEPKVAAEAPRADKTPVFRWPVRGRVITEFGAKSGSDRNDGINLAVPEGTSVKSAEDGEVIYSGNELKGYGNLVLVKHADGWVTAYAHASELLVNKGDKVTRGQIIARAGATGSVQQPQLHFELRKGQKPVDPTQYLTN